MEIRRLAVTNKQLYPIGRGKYVFPPGEEKEVTVATRQQYQEIKSCVYLRVQEISRDATYEISVEDDLATNLEAMTLEQLRGYAHENGIEIPRKGKQAILEAVLAAVAPDAEDPDSSEGVKNASQSDDNPEDEESLGSDEGEPLGGADALAEDEL